jgi:hypothetical protein
MFPRLKEIEFEDEARWERFRAREPPGSVRRDAPGHLRTRHAGLLILRLQSSSSSIRLLSFFSNLHAFTLCGAPDFWLLAVLPQSEASRLNFFELGETGVAY